MLGDVSKMGTPNVRSFTEVPTWHRLGEGWKPLWSGYGREGFSLEWHDFFTSKSLDISGSFHPDSVEICLNLAGEAAFQLGKEPRKLNPGAAMVYAPGTRQLQCTRLGGHHQFLTIEISREYLKRRFERMPEGLEPGLPDLLGSPQRQAGLLGQTRPLRGEHQRLIPDLQASPVSLSSRGLWYEGKMLGLMSEFFFKAPESELFCERQRRVARERVQKVISLLESNLAEPPDLLELGRQVGCSPFHLSRTFSQELGMTIPKYLRKLRMERAGMLLRTGRFNVTEAAMEVGYSSLSHFSQAFCQTMGCCPNLYPMIQAKTDRRPKP